MIAIIDYGLGNLFSLKSSLDFIGLETVLTNDHEIIKNSDAIILPGVGAFRDAIASLEKQNLKQLLINEAKSGKPFLGICLGMQLLFDKSYEYGEYEGLSLINGEIRSIKEDLSEGSKLKVPHMGWNSIEITKENKNDSILENVKKDEFIYYVHSFYAKTNNENIIAYSDYELLIPGVVKNKNVYGMQFHPEKSGEIGLKLLTNWGNIVKNQK